MKIEENNKIETNKSGVKGIKPNLKRLRKKFLGDFIGTETLKSLAGMLFKISSYTVSFTPVNYPEEKNYILALFHAHQCCLYALRPQNNVYVMVSNSKDGDIIAAAAEAVGVNCVRGSKSKHAVSATKKMIEIINTGKIGAITVDGPRGPIGTVHKGVISIAKATKVPIIPVVYYSPQWNFLKFKTWDQFRFPLGFVKLVVNFADPIYVNEIIQDDEIKLLQNDLHLKLKALYEDTILNYDKYIKEYKANPIP